MKKIVLIITSFFLLISCDEIYHSQLYITNNCNEPINVSITNSWNNVDTFVVDANTTFMFSEGQGITSPKGIVERSFLKFEVVKNEVKSKINYLEYNKWIYIEKQDKYHYELYLPISYEDFE